PAHRSTRFPYTTLFRSAQRMREILTDHGVSALATGESATLPEPGTVAVINAPLSRGFQLDAAALVVVSDSEIVGWRRRRRKLRLDRKSTRLNSSHVSIS